MSANVAGVACRDPEHAEQGSPVQKHQAASGKAGDFTDVTVTVTKVKGPQSLQQATLGDPGFKREGSEAAEASPVSSEYESSDPEYDESGDADSMSLFSDLHLRCLIEPMPSASISDAGTHVCHAEKMCAKPRCSDRALTASASGLQLLLLSSRTILPCVRVFETEGGGEEKVEGEREKGRAEGTISSPLTTNTSCSCWALRFHRDIEAQQWLRTNCT